MADKRVSRTFQKGKQYEFGTLKISADPQSTNPDWVNRPTIQAGEYFLQFGCTTPFDFCLRNPAGLSMQKPLTFYRIERDGTRTYIGAGTPSGTSGARLMMPDAGGMGGLGDDSFPPGSLPPHRMLPDHFFPTPPSLRDDPSVPWMQEQIRQLQNDVAGKDQTIMGLYNRLADKEREFAELKDQHAKQLQQLERRLAEAEMTNLIHKEIQKAKPASGLAGGPMEIAGMLMNVFDMVQKLKPNGAVAGGTVKPGLAGTAGMPVTPGPVGPGSSGTAPAPASPFIQYDDNIEEY